MPPTSTGRTKRDAIGKYAALSACHLHVFLTCGLCKRSWACYFFMDFELQKKLFHHLWGFKGYAVWLGCIADAGVTSRIMKQWKTNCS